MTGHANRRSNEAGPSEDAVAGASSGPAGPAQPRTPAITPRQLKQTARSGSVPAILWNNPAWFSLGAAIALALIGILAIRLTDNPDDPRFAVRQTMFLGIAIFGGVVAAIPRPRTWRYLSYPMAIGVILLLIFVLIPFVPHSIVRPRNGARRWITMIFVDFQPSELAKIAFVLAIAHYLRLRRNYRTLGGLLIPFGLMFIPMGLILVEPDLGTALLLPAVLVAMLLAAGAKLKHLIMIAVLGGSVLALIVVICLAAAAQTPSRYPILKPHQVERIQGMLNRGDRRLEDSINYQSTKATMLVGAGQLTGVGGEQSRILVEFNRLPEDHNDMIFAVIVNRWGFVGGAIVIALYLVYTLGLVTVAALSRNPFGRLICVGFCAVVLSQMCVNIGMTVGLLPITGMTLPFVSYGGSSLVALFFMTGIAIGIALRPPRFLARPSFEFDPKREGPDPLTRLR